MGDMLLTLYAGRTEYVQIGLISLKLPSSIKQQQQVVSLPYVGAMYNLAALCLSVILLYVDFMYITIEDLAVSGSEIR